MKLTEVSQVAFVAEDLQKSIGNFSKLFGIGPWRIYTYGPPNLTEMTVHGKPENYSMKIALTTIGATMLEVVQPLSGNSIYSEFLTEKGGGVHHVASYAVEDVNQAIEELKKQGIQTLQTGRFSKDGFTSYFAYMDTVRETGVVFEFVRNQGERPKPEAVYP